MSIRALKVVALIGFSLAWCAGASADDKPKTGFVSKTFTDAEGKKVPYVVFVPKDYDGKQPYPVILNADHTKGSGRTVFVQFKDFEPGQPQELEGRKVRVVKGVTIERSAPSKP